LEEENLDFIEVSDRIELNIAKAELLKNDGLVEDALDLL